MKVAILTVRASSGEEGGAERLFRALVQAFVDLGHEAEEVALRTDESTFEKILENYVHFYDMDLSAYDMVVSTKAPTWMVRHPRHVCYLMHTIRAFYDMFDELFTSPTPGLLDQRRLIHEMDTKALSAPHCREIFSIGHEVSGRLRKWNGRDARVLHPPLWENPFREGVSEAFLFLPGRLHSWKRTDLVIQAMDYVRSPVRLLLAGAGEAEADLRSMAGNGVEFLGRIPDDDLVDLYSRAFAVPFTPKREDYGFVTLEAFASGKPVVTCIDSGEAALIVQKQRGGIVCEPDPRAIAAAIDWLFEHAEDGRTMGQSGKTWVNSLDWLNIARTLIEAPIH